MNLKDALYAAGASAVAVTEAGGIAPDVAAEYHQWLGNGCHAGMEYLSRHEALRLHTDSVMEGARSVIVLAFNYYPAKIRSAKLPGIAYYAYGEDYHNALRKRLKPVVKALESIYGATCRICIDSAPIAERYWAVKSGIGVLGRNGAVIVPGVGSFIFLVEILTSLSVEELAEAGLEAKATARPCSDRTDSGKVIGCRDCEACVRMCPTGALRGDGTMDARRCLSYLTIEHQGEYSAEQRALLESLEAVPFYGCDLCLRVCPHNRNCRHTDIPEFSLSEALQSLNAATLTDITTADQFAAIFTKSPIKRLRLDGCRRNTSILTDKKKKE
jgi:epoxyqueuosine reductase